MVSVVRATESAEIERTPAFVMVASPLIVAKTGATPVDPRKSCPLVPAAVTWTAEVPFPITTPLEVRVVAPVPPLPTGRVPVTSVVRSTDVPSVEAIVDAQEVADVVPLATVVPVVEQAHRLGHLELAFLQCTGQCG